MNVIDQTRAAQLMGFLSLGHSIRDAARLAGVSKQTAQNWKDGRRHLAACAPGESGRYTLRSCNSVYASIAAKACLLEMDESIDLPEWPRDEPSRMRLIGALRARKETLLLRFSIRSLP